MWLSIGSDLIRKMIGLVLFTVVSVFVVLGYSWMVYYQSVYGYTAKVLSSRFDIPTVQIREVLRQGEIEVGNTMGFDVLTESEKYSLATLIFLTFLLPTLLAWWSSRRFAHPLTQLSKAARLITTGDFSTRIPLSKSLQHREDETALLLKDFNSMAMSLERFERERRYGLAAIAHELRTPVTVLRGRLEGVRDGVLVADSTELEKLLGHAKMLSQLIEDLQLVSLAEAGELRLENADFIVQDLLKRIHGDYLVKTQQSGLELKLILPTHEVWYYGDQQRLYQVLSNLINNALRHTPKNGWIELRLIVQHKSLLLEVQDSGAGFTIEAMNRAFERFYRSVDRGRKQGGSGLGLAISRSLVQAHGGKIELIPVEIGALLRVTLEQQKELP
jgi:signal transduction histidine kinase